jgi:hypothetical protein
VLVCFAEGFEEELNSFRDPGLKEKIGLLRDRLEKAPSFEVGLLLDPIKPFNKRRIEKYRLITKEVQVSGQRVLMFCKTFQRADANYLSFLRSPSLPVEDSLEDTASKYVQALRATVEPSRLLPPTMTGWLQPLMELQIGAKEEGYDIHESRRWVNQVRRVFIDEQRGLQLLHKVIERVVVGLEEQPPTWKPDIHSVQVGGEAGCYILWGLHDARTICLLDALVTTPSAVELAQAAAVLGGENYKAEVKKAYWSWVTFDSELWRDIELSEEGNLFLSPDELSLLITLSGTGFQASEQTSGVQKGLPALISGRAGTGKSTMLAYIFASLMLKQANENLEGYPIYVTYNSRLLQQARRTIRGLLRSNSVFRRKVNAGSKERLEAALSKLESTHVVSFHDLLRTYLTSQQRERFDDHMRVDFSDFKSAYLGIPTLLGVFPDHGFRRTMSPERAWYIIRQFIKGSGYEIDSALDQEREISDAHAELTGADRQGVTADEVALVFARVYKSWYRSELSRKTLWDDQDLVWQALESLTKGVADRPKIAAIICDEAQDFTPREIRFLVRCCELLRFELPNENPAVPIVLAGDSLQTLSPTGFRWSAVKAILFEEIWAACGKDSAPITLTLQNNYRSRDAIVKFCNLVQLNRKNLFPYREDSKDIKPQHAWDSSPSALPLYFKVGVNLTEQEVREIAKSRIMLLPCEEAGEREYIDADPTLKPLLKGKSDQELTAYLMSSSAAKGQEFPQVFLYNFGRYFTDEGFDMESSTAETAKQFAKEFFFNKLYVAASRAGQSLVIIENDADTAHVPALWTDMIAQALVGEEISSKLQSLISRFPDFHEKVVVAEFGNDRDWSDAQSAVTPEQAEAFLKAGIEGKDEQTLRRAAAMFLQLGVPYQERAAEALGYAHRLRFDFEGSVEHFRRAGNLKEAWTSSIEGALWSQATEIRSTYSSAPNHEAALVSMMRAPQEDVVAIVDLCSSVSSAMRAGVFRHTRIWVKAQEEVKRRIALLLGESVTVREPTLVGVSLHELRDALLNVAYGATALSHLRAEVGDLYLASRAWGQATREYQDASALTDTQLRRLKFSRANQLGFPRGLVLLAEAEMHSEVISVWDGHGSPLTNEWYHVVERALNEIGDHLRRFDFAIATQNIPHALTSLNSPELRDSPIRTAMLVSFVEAASKNFEKYGLITSVISGISDDDALLSNQLIERVVLESVSRWENPADYELGFQSFSFRSTESVPYQARNTVYAILQKYDREVGIQVLDPRWHGRALEFANDWQSAWEHYVEFTRNDVARDIRDFCRAGYLRAVHRWGERAGAAADRGGFSTELRTLADERLKIAKEWRLVGKKVLDRGNFYDDDLCKDRNFLLSTVPLLISRGAEEYQESGEFSDFFWQKAPRGTLLSFYSGSGLLAWVIDPSRGGSVTEANGAVLTRRVDGLFEITAEKWKVEVRFSKSETRVTIKAKSREDAESDGSDRTVFRLRA